MPAVSQQQFKFFKALENNPELRKKHKISKKEAKEYTNENVGKKSFKNLPKFKKIKGKLSGK